MKKSSFIKRLSVLLGAVSLIILLFSCQSASKAFEVRPLDLLGTENDVFISVPKSGDGEFLKSIILEYAGEISEKDLQTLISRVDHIYCGVSENKRGFSIQGVVSGNIPKVFASNIFSAKKGFSKMEYKTGGSGFDVYLKDSMNFVIPENNLICIYSASETPSMLDTYVSLKTSGPLELDDHFAFLEKADKDIRFYSPNPAVILSKLIGYTGINLNLNLSWIEGTFFENTENQEYYSTDITLCFESSKYVKAGKVLLGMALSFASPEVSGDDENPNILYVKNLKLKKKQLMRILNK